VVVADSVVPFKITRATRGQDGVIECTARYEDPEIYSAAYAGQSANLPTNVFVDVGESLLYLFNGPLLIPSNDDSGFYWAVDAASSVWRGADIQRSIDAGDTYTTLSGAAVRAIGGTVAVALPDGPVGYMDEGNEIEVALIYGGHQLAGVTEEVMFAGANTFWLGTADGSSGEVIGFRDAELVTPGVYRLSGLLRGRRGTDHAMASHGPDEVFVLLSVSTVGRSDYGSAEWNAARLYRAPSVLQEAVDADVISFTNTGEALRPFSPVHVTGTRDGSNNLTVEWIRRSRTYAGGLAGPVPLGEESERYEVDVWRAGILKRTIASSSEVVVYTAADQTTDGYTPGDAVTVDVYQLSATRGRGHARRAII
jgi:hypothetical protein